LPGTFAPVIDTTSIYFIFKTRIPYFYPSYKPSTGKELAHPSEFFTLTPQIACNQMMGLRQPLLMQ